jgi:hypothetical protein
VIKQEMTKHHNLASQALLRVRGATVEFPAKHLLVHRLPGTIRAMEASYPVLTVNQASDPA